MRFVGILVGTLPIIPLVSGASFSALIDRLKKVDEQAEKDAKSVLEESDAFQGWCDGNLLQPSNITDERNKKQDLARVAAALGATVAKFTAEVEGSERQAEDSRQSWVETITTRTKEHASYLKATKESKDTLEIYQQVLEVLAQEESLEKGGPKMPDAEKSALMALKARVVSGSSTGGGDYKVIIGTIKGMIDMEKKATKERDRSERLSNTNVGEVITTVRKTIEEFEEEAEVHREKKRLAQSEKAIASQKYAATSSVLADTLKGNDQLHQVCMAAKFAGESRAKELEKFRSQVALALKYAEEAEEHIGGEKKAAAFVTHYKPVVLKNRSSSNIHSGASNKTASKESLIKLGGSKTSVKLKGKVLLALQPSLLEVRVFRNERRKDPTTDRMMRAIDTADKIAGIEDEKPKEAAQSRAAHTGEVEAAKWTLMIAAQRTGRSSLENAANELVTHSVDDDVKMLLSLKKTIAQEDPDAAAEDDKAYGQVSECVGSQVNASKKAISTAQDVHDLGDAVADINSTVVGKAAEVEILEAGLEDAKNLANALREQSDALTEAFKANRENSKTALLEAEKDFGDTKDALRAMDATEARYTVHTDGSSVSSTRAGSDAADARDLIRYIQNLEKTLETLSEESDRSKHLDGMLQNAVLGGTGRIKEQEKALKEVRAAREKAEEALDEKKSDLTSAEQIADDEKLAAVNEEKRCKKLMQQGLPAVGAEKEVGTSVAESAVDTAVNLLKSSPDGLCVGDCS